MSCLPERYKIPVLSTYELGISKAWKRSSKRQLAQQCARLFVRVPKDVKVIHAYKYFDGKRGPDDCDE